MEWHFSGICEDLPKSNGKSMVVDRFRKDWHFMTLQHPYTAGQVPKVFLIPYSKFELNFKWALASIKVSSDGQTKSVNKTFYDD